MILKIFKAIWFLSVLAVLAVLLYSYAGLPEEVFVQDDSSGKVSMSREVLFYIAVGVIAIVNVLVFIIAKVYKALDDFRSWFYGQITTINLFIIIALSLISVYNSSEKFDYGDIGFSIYGSVILVVIWAMSWPGYLVFKKFFIKQAV